MDMHTTPLQTIELDPGVTPAATIIVLHGLGADGTDFLPFGDEIDLGAAGPVRWVLPRAPMRAVTINNGYRMRAWYDIVHGDLSQREDAAGLRASFAQVHALVEREMARGVPSERIVLGGFSQGAAITLGAGLRCPHRLAGLVGLSGYLPLADKTAAERHDANAKTPVLLAHGRRDGIVPLARGAAARDALVALGMDVQWNDYPMEHSVSAEEMAAIKTWLLSLLTRGDGR